MKLEDIVCSLELSKKLHELGVKQESIFSWSGADTLYPRLVVSHCETERSGDFLIRTFTDSELLELLPPIIKITNLEFGLRICKLDVGDSYEVIYDTFSIDNDYDRNEFLHNVDNYNLSNSLAKMFIHLIENKIIEVR